jgi:hypothetical protein
MDLAGQSVRRFLRTKQQRADETVQNTIANRTEISSWPDPSRGDVFGPDLLVKALKDTPSLKYRLSWEPVQDNSPKAVAQRNQQTDEATKQILLNVCRWGNLAYNDANISVVLQHFREGCSQYDLEQAITSNQIHLAGASWQEIEENTNTLLRQHAIKWKNKSLAEVKAGSAQERAEREAIFARVTPTLAAPAGTTPLPAVITKEKIQAALNSGDRQTIHIWATRYGGMDAINSRLQGLN